MARGTQLLASTYFLFVFLSFLIVASADSETKKSWEPHPEGEEGKKEEVPQSEEALGFGTDGGVASQQARVKNNNPYDGLPYDRLTAEYLLQSLDASDLYALGLADGFLTGLDGEPRTSGRVKESRDQVGLQDSDKYSPPDQSSRESDLKAANGGQREQTKSQRDTDTGGASSYNSEEDALASIMEVLFARYDVRDVQRGVAELKKLAGKLDLAAAFPLWRPKRFLPDDALENMSTAFATNEDGSVRLGNGYYLVKPKNAQVGIWALEKRGTKYIFGNTQETLDYYGQGAGAPSPEVEYSGVALEELDAEGGNEEEETSSTDAMSDDIAPPDDRGAQGVSANDRGEDSEDLEEEEESVRWTYGPSGWTYTGAEDSSPELEAAASDAMFLLGVLSASGITSEHHSRNDTRAVEAYLEAGDTGSLQAILALSTRYILGRGVNKSCQAALWYLKTVADKVLVDIEKTGDYLAAKEPFRLRKFLQDGAYMANPRADDNPEQVDLDEDQAFHGVPAYQRHLGYRRLLGQGVDRDPQEAYRHFQAAAAAGDEVAAFNLGYMHMNGLGKPVNHTIAQEFFKTAAKKNLPAAYNGLGVLHFNGWGTKVNYTQARLYFLQGAKRGDPDSFNNLGLLHTAGYEVPKDPKKGLQYFELAAEKGHWRAPYTAALIHAEGTGVPVNCSQAVRLLRKFVTAKGTWNAELEQAMLAYVDGDYWSALFRYSVLAEEGSTVAMENAAHMLRRGEGFQGEERYLMAALHLRRATDLGSNHSLIDVAHLYASGLVPDADPSLSLGYYQRAADLGLPEAYFSLAVLHQFGRFTCQNFTMARELLRTALNKSRGAEKVPVVLAQWGLSCHETVAFVMDSAAWAWFQVSFSLGQVAGTGTTRGPPRWLWLMLAGWDTVLVLVLSVGLVVVCRLRSATRQTASVEAAEETDLVDGEGEGDEAQEEVASLDLVGQNGEGSTDLHEFEQQINSGRSNEGNLSRIGGEGSNGGLHHRQGLRARAS